MDRLSIILTIFVGATIAGTLIAAVLAMGWYSWPAISGAFSIGVLAAWPASFAISRRIKRQDPGWDNSRISRVDGIIPDPEAPEV